MIIKDLLLEVKVSLKMNLKKSLNSFFIGKLIIHWEGFLMSRNGKQEPQIRIHERIHTIFFSKKSLDFSSKQNFCQRKILTLNNSNFIFSYWCSYRFLISYEITPQLFGDLFRFPF